MAEPANVTTQIARLEQENAKLRGEILATGVLLAQLLQSICKTQLNPHGFANRIMKDAQDAVEAFKPDSHPETDGLCKQSALETIRHYDQQIRSVLPI